MLIWCTSLRRTFLHVGRKYRRAKTPTRHRVAIRRFKGRQRATGVEMDKAELRRGSETKVANTGRQSPAGPSGSRWRRSGDYVSSTFSRLKSANQSIRVAGRRR